MPLLVVAATVSVRLAAACREPLLPIVAAPVRVTASTAMSKPSIVVTLPVALTAPATEVAVEVMTSVAEPTRPPVELPPTVTVVTATP